jgi:type I restriction enzyme S subunit
MKPKPMPSAVNSPAPTGRTRTAQGPEGSDAALGHAPQNTPSPEGATQDGELPKGWTWKSLAEIATDGVPILYGILQPGPDTPGGVPYVRPTEIVDDVIDLSSIRRTTPTIAGKYKRSVLKPDDIILSIVGTIGKVAVVPSDLDGGNITQSSVRLRPRSDLVSPRYVAWVLRSPVLRRQFDKHRLGTAVPRLNVAHVRALRVPVPPLPEQRRIVAEIEKQFTRLDAGVAALRRVQANLKRYRAAVLKAACEGRLVPTEAAWKETTLGEVLIRIEAGRSFKCEERPPRTGEIGVVKVSAVTWGNYEEAESKTCLDDSRTEERFLVRPNDFLFSRANTIELIGACVIAKRVTLRVMLSDKILRFHFSSEVNPSWILNWLRSGFGRSEIERLATGNQESMRNIGQDRIRQINISLPPLAEQTRIVAEVERRLSVVEELESVVTANLQRATRLRQSILQKAFSGELNAGDKVE